MSAWGGFKRRVHGVLFGWICQWLGFADGSGSAGPAGVGGFSGVVHRVLSARSSMAPTRPSGKAKVAPDVQGRVFAARRLIAWLTRRSPHSSPGRWPTWCWNPRCGGRRTHRRCSAGWWGRPGRGHEPVDHLRRAGSALVGPWGIPSAPSATRRKSCPTTIRWHGLKSKPCQVSHNTKRERPHSGCTSRTRS